MKGVEKMREYDKGEEWKSCMNCRFCDDDIDTVPCQGCLHTAGFPKWEPDGIHAKNDQEEKGKKEIELKKRPEMLAFPVPIYDRTDSEIPEKVRISFTNGTSAIYMLHVDQPKPLVMESIRIIRKWRSEGNQYVPQRRRRNRK